MDLYAWLGVVAGLVGLLAFGPYIMATLLGVTRPNRATWAIWSLVGVMLATSYFSASGERVTIWVPISYVIGPIVTALLSIWYGVGGWTRLDRLCLIIAAISAVMWWLTGQPVLALLLNLLVDLVGVIPTLRKAYNEPESEDRLAWTMSCLANGLNVLALNPFRIAEWTFAESVYPLYMFVAVGLVTSFIYVRGYQLRPPAV